MKISNVLQEDLNAFESKKLKPDQQKMELEHKDENVSKTCLLQCNIDNGRLLRPEFLPDKLYI